MLELIFLLIIVLLFIVTYFVSLYSLSVYVDPDEVEELLPNVPKSYKKILLKMSDDPRGLIQIAEVFKSFSLIVITVLSSRLLLYSASELGVRVMPITIVGLIIIWFIYITVVELFPRYASRKALQEGTANNLWIMIAVYFLFSPVTKTYRKALSRSEAKEEVTEEEKEDIVERAIETVAERAGISQTLVDEEEKEMINQIFLLDQTVVREIMIPRMDIIGIDSKMSFSEIRQLVFKDGHSRYPVFDETIDKIIGLIYVKDLFNKMPEAGEKFKLSKYLKQPYLVPETKIIGDLLREFKNKRQHIALVVDEYGGLAGLVTLEDIIEEIFGEIQDEHDREPDDISTLADGRLLVDASMMVEKLQDYFETEFDQGDYDSIGGLIYDLVGSVPEEGQKIKWYSMEFEVNELDGQRIISVKVRNRT